MGFSAASNGCGGRTPEQPFSLSPEQDVQVNLAETLSGLEAEVIVLSPSYEPNYTYGEVQDKAFHL